MKSHDPAARSTLFGCQSRLRTVERIGFLMCLLTHLEDKKISSKHLSKTNIPNMVNKCEDTNVCFQVVTLFGLPVIFRFKVANRYEASSTAHCKLVLQWRPLHECGGTIDPEDNKSGLPHPILLAPHVSIAIRSTSYNPVAFWSPVNSLKYICPINIR